MNTRNGAGCRCCRWVQVYEHSEWVRGSTGWLMSRIELMTENCRSEMNSAKITNVTQSISNRLKSIHVVCCRDPHNSEHLFATCRTSRLTGYRLMHTHLCTGLHLILVTLQCDLIELLEHHIQLFPVFFRGWHTSIVFDSSFLRTSNGQSWRSRCWPAGQELPTAS